MCTHINIVTGGKHSGMESPTTKMLALLPTASGKLQAAVVEESETFSSGVMELLWVKQCPAPSKM